MQRLGVVSSNSALHAFKKQLLGAGFLQLQAAMTRKSMAGVLFMDNFVRVSRADCAGSVVAGGGDQVVFAV